MKRAFQNLNFVRDNRTERHGSHKKRIHTSYVTWHLGIKLTLGGIQDETKT